jgi:Zn-dependent protease
VAGQIDFVLLAVYAVVLLFSLSIHESAHAWAADRLGDPTGRMLGRVTLNPLPHIDPIGTVLFPLVGFLAGGLIFGWAKPVPVNGANLGQPRRDHVFIAAAGPASNIAAAVGFLLLLKLFGSAAFLSPAVAEPLLLLFRAGLILNVVLAVFNLLPVPPLDGSWILEGILPEPLAALLRSIRPYGFLILLGLLYTGVFGTVLRPVLSVVRDLAF